MTKESLVYKCNLCLKPIFTSLNVVSPVFDQLLLRNKMDLASSSTDWDYKHKGTLICPTKGCMVRIGNFDKSGVKVGNEAVTPAVYVDNKTVTKAITTPAALTKYQVTKSTIKF